MKHLATALAVYLACLLWPKRQEQLARNGVCFPGGASIRPEVLIHVAQGIAVWEPCLVMRGMGRTMVIRRAAVPFWRHGEALRN